jgi:hypothetical protein
MGEPAGRNSLRATCSSPNSKLTMCRAHTHAPSLVLTCISGSTHGSTPGHQRTYARFFELDTKASVAGRCIGSSRACQGRSRLRELFRQLINGLADRVQRPIRLIHGLSEVSKVDPVGQSRYRPVGSISINDHVMHLVSVFSEQFGTRPKCPSKNPIRCQR